MKKKHDAGNLPVPLTGNSRRAYLRPRRRRHGAGFGSRSGTHSAQGPLPVRTRPPALCPAAQTPTLSRHCVGRFIISAIIITERRGKSKARRSPFLRFAAQDEKFGPPPSMAIITNP